MEERKNYSREDFSRQEKLNALQNALLCSNIDLDEVLENIDSMTKKKILEQHAYAVTENKDGRFSTYVTDTTKPNNRRKIVKSSKELLEKEIIKFYREREKKNKEKKICLKDFYAEWLNYKSLRTNSSAYIRTINELWKRYYVNDKVSDIPLVDLDKYTLDVWAHTLIKECRMTKKQYYNMAVIMRQDLELAVEKNIIPENPFSKVKIDRKLFTPVKKKPDETQVYLLNEQSLIEKEAYADFEATGNTACLGIPFAFQTGMRISEIVALKWSDIGEEKENCIHVQRMETKDYKRLPDGTFGSPERIVIERTKSLAGTRNVYLTSKARGILEQIRKSNLKNGYDDSGYIFLNEKGRMNTLCLDTRIRKYCRHINISEKGMHKVRKTYISTLIDSENININYIREQVGHSDERTTFGNYCFNRKPKDQTAEEMEKALVFGL